MPLTEVKRWGSSPISARTRGGEDRSKPGSGSQDRRQRMGVKLVAQLGFQFVDRGSHGVDVANQALDGDAERGFDPRRLSLPGGSARTHLR